VPTILTYLHHFIKVMGATAVGELHVQVFPALALLTVAAPPLVMGVELQFPVPAEDPLLGRAGRPLIGGVERPPIQDVQRLILGDVERRDVELTLKEVSAMGGDVVPTTVVGMVLYEKP